MNGINKLFFYNFQEQMTSTSTAISTTSLNTNSQVIFSITDIAITDNILKMPKQVRENADNTIILYFVRHDTIQEVSQTQIHKANFVQRIQWFIIENVRVEQKLGPLQWDEQIAIDS